MAMVSYSTAEYYNDTYLMGRQAVIGAALIPFYLLKATKDIKRYTSDNIVETEPFTDDVQMCCCELADYIYTSEQAVHTQGVSSEKVGEYSVSYEASKDTEEVKRIAIKNIVYSWLSETGLLYRGVM